MPHNQHFGITDIQGMGQYLFANPIINEGYDYSQLAESGSSNEKLRPVLHQKCNNITLFQAQGAKVIGIAVSQTI